MFGGDRLGGIGKGAFMSMVALTPEQTRPEASPRAGDALIRSLKGLIWLYFWLLIFEGVLRKWIVPQWSAPLLIIRDPVVVAIYILALSKGRFPLNFFALAIAALGLLSVGASLVGEGTLAITLFGFRTNFLHLPLIFVIPAVFQRRDVEKIGRWFLLLAPAIALLVVAQFRGGSGSWLNVGAGGGEGGQIEAGYGKIRPPGPFSFVTGMVAYSSLLTAFLIDHYLRGRIHGRLLVISAAVSVALCLGLSGSRSSIAAVAVVGLAAVFAALRRGSLGKLIFGPFLLGAVAYFGLSLWSEFRLGLEVNAYRFGTGGVKDGLILRYLGDLLAPFGQAAEAPLFGHGLGLGTNAGSALRTGKAEFLLAEGEWARVILESGPLLGFAFIALRLGIVIHLALASLRQLRTGNTLPLLIFGACSLGLMNGQFGPPTSLGFAVFGGGLCLAACRVPRRMLFRPAEEPVKELAPEDGRAEDRLLSIDSGQDRQVPLNSGGTETR